MGWPLLQKRPMPFPLLCCFPFVFHGLVQAPCSFSPLSFLWNSGTGPPSAGLRDKIQVSSAQSSTFSHPSGYGPACTSQRGRMNRNWWGPPKLSFSWNWILASESDLTCGLTQSISGTIHSFSLSFLDPVQAQPKQLTFSYILYFLLESWKSFSLIFYFICFILSNHSLNFSFVFSPVLPLPSPAWLSIQNRIPSPSIKKLMRWLWIFFKPGLRPTFLIKVRGEN